MPVPTPLGGSCHAGFEPVREAFSENFASRGEVGASLCLIIDGRVVADLWGGWTDGDRTVPWQHDTLVNVFSVGKAVAAVCVARLVGHGRLDFDQAVADVWPEFAAQGKDHLTVRQLLSHQGGLPAIREPMPAGSVFDVPRLCDALAAQAPWWTPGAAHGYHTNTYGVLVGELVRRVSGRSLGTFVREEICGPLGADVHIGVREADLARVAEYLWPTSASAPAIEGVGEAQMMEYAAYFNPPEFSGAGVVNTTQWRQAELPSTNGHATAAGIARFYAALVAGGRLDGVDVVDGAALRAAAEEQVYGDDLVLHRPSRFGIGFQLTQAERPLGPNPGAYGHFGAGGSLGFCDPAAGLAFGYAINTMGPRWQNPRNKALIDAVYECL